MATGNKLMKEITDQFLHCKICLEAYKDPKTLVCLHTFCTECLQKHVDSDSNRSSRFLLYSRYITCPLCRRKTEIPTGGVRRLPDNFLVSSLNDVIDRKRVSKVPPCEICTSDRPRHSNNACFKCLDCVKLLCKSCVDLHMTTRVTQNHSLIDIEGEKDIECKNHPEEIVRFYCEPCDECICIVCTFQEHRDHEICSFSDGFSKYKAGLDTLLTQCRGRLQEVQTRIGAINKMEGALKETRENIRDLAISYISQVRTTEKQLMQRVDQEFGDKVQTFLQNKEWLQENFDGLQTTCNLAEIIINDRGVEMLLLKKDLQSKMSTLLEPALPPEPEDIVQDIKFVPGNVKLGYISVKADDDADGGSTVSDSDVDPCLPPKKRLCANRDAQRAPPPSPTSTVTSIPDVNVLVPTEFPGGSYTVTVNGTLEDDTETASRTDVSVNTMCSMVDSNREIFPLDEPTAGICVKCCAELKKDHSSSSSMSSLPVIDGTPPTVQDIIITNMGDSDKERRRRRRALIKSRRVQTDISLSNEDCSQDDSLLRVSSQESLGGFRRYSSSSSLTPVAEPVETRSIGLDPIFPIPAEVKPVPRSTRTKSVMTIYPVKPVVDTSSVRTNTPQPDLRHSTTMTYPSLRTMDTQTPEKITVNKGIATDYAGQRNKHTSTPIINTIDSGTCMPTLVQESKTTWTDQIQTTERSVCTEGGETTETGTETMQPILVDQGIGVKPETRTVDTNTPVQEGSLSFTATASASVEKEDKKSKKEKEKSTEKKKKEKEKKEKKEKRASKKYVDSSTETEPVIRSDKETGTLRVPYKDQWTATVSPQYVNTGISPARPATREAAVATNPVSVMEQGTYTTAVELRDNQTETVTIVRDNETLTELVDRQDAQTCVDVFSESVEVGTDTCYTVDTACSTDDAWIEDLQRTPREGCEYCNRSSTRTVDTATSPVPLDTSDRGTMVLSISKTNNLVDCDTQTPSIVVYDKSIATSCDFDETDTFKSVDCVDAATSTESLPYIGLFSDMDCDELILVPEIAIDMIESDSEYERLYNESFPVPVAEAETQTLVSAAYLNMDLTSAEETELGPDVLMPNHEHFITIGVNTEPKLTFEKETSMQAPHHLSKGTMTLFMATQDKTTNTGVHVKAIQEKLGLTPAQLAKLPKVEKKDVSTVTDSYLLDEKMIACINKLKNVSEKLNSPTSKTSSESLPWNKKSDSDDSSGDNVLIKELGKCSETERRKNVMELAAKSQAMVRSKDSKAEPTKRKAQPITTLKGKYPEKSSEQEEQKKQGPQRQLSADHAGATGNVKMGSQGSSPKKGLHTSRNNSAPGRIATVASPSAMPKRSPKTSPKVTNTKILNNRTSDNFSTLPTPKPDQQSPEFYSTVPKTRHPKHALPIISESRASSTRSDSSNASFVSAKSAASKSTTSNSSDLALDLSSLKIKSPPAAQSPSPQPVRKKEKTSRAPPSMSTTIEVIPTIDIIPETRVRTGSTSSDQTDPEPHQEKKGFMKKLFGSKKKKSVEKRNRSPSKSPKPPRKATAEPKQPPPEPPKEKVQKPKPFVYMRSRIFAIQQDDEDKYSKPTVSKYCVPKQEETESGPTFDFAATFAKK